MSGSYRLLLRAPGAAPFYLTTSLGRIGIAMTSLGIVWLVHARTGSFTSAGLVAGAFALAEGSAGPQVARLVDRLRQPRVLPPLAVGHAVLAAGLLLATDAGVPLAVLALAGAAMGASIPQLGALSLTRWTALVRRLSRPGLTAPAFSLDSISNATAYLLGPVLVSLVGASGHPAVATAVAAGLVSGGSLALAVQTRTAPPAGTAPGRPGARPRTLLSRRFLLLLGANVAIGIYLGSMQVSVTAFARQTGDPDLAAPMYAVSSVAGLLGGWLFGLLGWRARPARQLLVTTATLSVAAGGLVLMRGVPGVAVALGLTGLLVPPVLVLISARVAREVDPGVLTQAFTWLNSGSAAGSAAAAGLAGLVIDHVRARGGFGLAAGAAVAMTLLAAALDRAGSSGPDRPPPQPPSSETS